jgi:hypothetical protein
VSSSSSWCIIALRQIQQARQSSRSCVIAVQWIPLMLYTSIHGNASDDVLCFAVLLRRFEMGMLQERADLTERDLATYRHDVGTLRAERDHLVNQVGACCMWQQQ